MEQSDAGLPDDPRAIHVALPLGIGDCHWVVTKLRALSVYHDGAPIYTYTGTSPNHKTDGYLSICPQVTEARYSAQAPKGLWGEIDNPNHRDIHWASLKNCANWRTFTYVLQANGHLEASRPLRTFLPELDECGGTEFEYAPRITDAERARAATLGGAHPVIVYTAGVGPNAGFQNHQFGVDHWVEVCERLVALGLTPVLCGANNKDDLRYRDWLVRKLARYKLPFLDTTGQTSIPEYCALIESARVWIGFNSGGGIVSAMRRTPTVMLWSDSTYPITGVHELTVLPPAMQRSWLTDEQLTTYRTLSFGSPELTPAAVVAKAMEVIR